MSAKSPSVSIIVPVRSTAKTLCYTLDSLIQYAYCEHTEIIIVNDASEDDIRQIGSRYPAVVVDGNGGGAAAARNIGVQFAKGRLLVFLDADCRVSPAWLSTHIAVHDTFGGLLAVGGSICMAPDARFWARCDHYCSWYNASPGLPATWVPNHPSANLSMTRATFYQVGFFREDLPGAGVHEETEWQERFQTIGGRIRFEPRAAVWHIDRDDLSGFLTHNYKWGYNSIVVKTGTDVSRYPWLYRKPGWLIAGFLPFAIAHTVYTINCWLRVGRLEPFFLIPVILLGRLAYASGMALGGLMAYRNQKY